jgi:hypothetical protein
MRFQTTSYIKISPGQKPPSQCKQFDVSIITIVITGSSLADADAWIEADAQPK